jgi:predicted nucleic acid-binding protein
VVAARVVYLDASALVKLVISEQESEALRAYVSTTSRRLSSRIAEVEVSRAVGRVAQPGDEEQVRAVLSGLQLVEVDGRISTLAASVAPRTLRSLDAIHLASALTVREELEAVVTYDGQLADAARAAGLEVVAPN